MIKLINITNNTDQNGDVVGTNYEIAGNVVGVKVYPTFKETANTSEDIGSGGTGDIPVVIKNN